MLIPLRYTSGDQQVFHVVSQRIGHVALVLGELSKVLHKGLRDGVRTALMGISREQHVMTLRQSESLSSGFQSVSDE